MTARIDTTAFGSITIDGTIVEHDVVIRPRRQVTKRKKKLSKAVYGTSHIISVQEARYVCEQAAGSGRLIIGSAQRGNVALSAEVAAYLKRRKCRVVLMPTPEVIKIWNQTKGKRSGCST
ncbi:MTH938/NDUFAF3 family protein [Dactylosporangium sp. NPDC005572]|uniref:MTH938/NDUFAF3 family protein n=1 Tax=Dactylosporangium sp. NPDC005572 TaxID=3156889 RepID=UPI0033B9558B